MDPAYSISIEDEAGTAELDIALLRGVVERVLEGESVAPGASCTIALTDDEELRRLNLEFRGIDAPTDVLSFEMGDDDGFPPGDADGPELGDIVVSVDTARRQAAEHAWSLQQEVAHLAVHGLLHLCGWDHEAGDEAEAAMRVREEHYLGPLGPVHEPR